MNYEDKHAHPCRRATTERQRSLHFAPEHLLEDQRLDVWLGDTACMHNEANPLFISARELVSGVIRDVDTFIT